MYFNEGRRLNQPHYKDPEPPNAVNLAPQPAKQSPGCASDGQCHAVKEWKTAKMLDSANNKLQELMQLLYLLSRDPAVPNEARYHVTVAQGEIALLARVIRNTTQDAAGDNLEPAAPLNLRPAHP